MHEQIRIEARDGVCEAHVLRPDGKGRWPAVLMYMDGIGMRDALVEIASRIAGWGYLVLLPDVFYRTGHRVADVNSFFTDPAVRKEFMEKVVPSATAEKVMADTRSFLAFLESRPDARAEKIGI